MAKIDTSGWKEFRIGDLFDAQLSKDDIQPKSIVDGDVPLISSGKENNGVLAHIFDADAAIWDAGTLTVDMFGKAFYQPKPYHCVSHGRVNIFTPKHDISEKVGLFLASIIEKVTCNKYGFTEMCTGTKLLKEVIKLPATSSGEPDWDYMEQYMSEVMQCSKASLESLCKSIVEKECVR